MNDNSDMQELLEGQVIDIRIESLIHCALSDMWDEDDFDNLFNEVIQEFVSDGAPTIFAASIGKDATFVLSQMSAIMNLLHVEFYVAFPASASWPGDFAILPDARYATSVNLGGSEDFGDDDYTDWMPGKTLDQSLLLSLLQIARERSREQVNQGELRLLIN